MLWHPVFRLKRASHIVNLRTVNVGVIYAVGRALAVWFFQNRPVARSHALGDHEGTQARLLLFFSVLFLLSLGFQFPLDSLVFDRIRHERVTFFQLRLVLL